MYNIRYHIASLVGVFLALSVGLLLGTVVAERGTLDDQRDAIINGLERDFDALSSENAALAEENETRTEFVEELVPWAVRDTLAGKRILVLANAGRSDGLGAVQDAITAAGGTPVTVLMEEKDFGVGTESVDAAIASFVPTATSDPVRSVAASLAAEWLTPLSTRPLTTALDDAGMLSATDLDAGMKVDGVVVLSAWDDGPDELAIDVGRRFADAGAPAVGAQAASRDTGVAAAARDAGLSAVDVMGEPEGAFSLGWVLSGRASGYFGTGAGATAPFPKP